MHVECKKIQKLCYLNYAVRIYAVRTYAVRTYAVRIYTVRTYSTLKCIIELEKIDSVNFKSVFSSPTDLNTFFVKM